MTSAPVFDVIMTSRHYDVIIFLVKIEIFCFCFLFVLIFRKYYSYYYFWIYFVISVAWIQDLGLIIPDFAQTFDQKIKKTILFYFFPNIL